MEPFSVKSEASRIDELNYIHILFKDVVLNSKCIREEEVVMTDKLKEFLDVHGVITNREANEIGISRLVLSKLVKEGELERVKNGVYQSSDSLVVDPFIVIGANNNVVFSYNSALYLHDLSDRAPLFYDITVPQGYNVEHIRKRFPDIRVHYVNKDRFGIGKTWMTTPMGNMVMAYDRERCICDIIRDRKNIDLQVFICATRSYFRENREGFSKLIEYSRKFNVESKVRSYLEVLS